MSKLSRLKSRNLRGVRRKKRDAQLKLTREEKDDIFWVKKTRFMNAAKWNDVRNLRRINGDHNKDFTNAVLGLSKKFPGEEIVVVDEGAGRSSFDIGLRRSLKGRVKIRVIRTGVGRMEKGPWKNRENIRITPEELVKTLGRDSVHLLVSSAGGTNYTEVDQRKAVANIIQVLKPGGMASIVSADTEHFLGGRRISLSAIEKVLKNYPKVHAHQLGRSGISVITLKKMK